MKRVYFAAGDEGEKAKPRVAVFAEMAGGHAVAAFNKKQLGAPAKRDELLRGFERPLPEGSGYSTLRVQSFPIERPPGQNAPIPTPESPSGQAFEPYRVRAWLDGRELREVVGHAGREDARAAIVLLLLVGLSETISGVGLYASAGPTRLLFTGPVFLLGALGAGRRWSWATSLALVVAIADTLLLLARSAQAGSANSFLLAIVARLALASALWKLQKSRS